MILALLTTMKSKVKVHVVDGSKCVLDCSHEKEEAGPRRPTILGCSSGGPVWVWGWGGRRRTRSRAWWLTMA